MRGMAVAAAGLAMLGCQSTKPQEATVVADLCRPLEARVTFSCWWSSPNAPYTHCVAWPGEGDECGLRQKAGAYLTRGATSSLDPGRHPDGTWVGVTVRQDEEGRVGLLSSRSDGVDYLHHHDQSPIPMGVPIPPRWPRFPAGAEFGPQERY